MRARRRCRAQTFTSAGKVTDKGSDVSLAAKGAVGKHFAFEKVKMTSKGVVSADLELRGAVASTTFYFAGEDGLADSGAKNKADVGVAYEKGSFFGRLNAGLLAGPTFSPHFVYKSGSVAVGAQGSFKATGGLDAATYDAGLAYLGDGYTVATQSSKNFKAASAGYYHKLSWGGAAAKVSYDHTQADKKKAVSGVVGAKYAFDDATTGTMKLGVREMRGGGVGAEIDPRGRARSRAVCSRPSMSNR